MSEELSRVKSRQKKYKGEAQTSSRDRHPNVREGSPYKDPEPSVTVPASLSRKARYSSAPDKSSAERRKAGEDEEKTPSRSETYPSERVRLSKIFVNTLIFMFVLLVASLFWWGKEGAPELRTLW